MAIISIQLTNGVWKYDDEAPLGKAGGFGEVFLGQGIDGEVAVKRLKLNAAQAAHRELDIGHRLMGRELSHIVPILDAGQDANSDRYYLIMPRCECSLQDRINEADVDIQTASSAITAITQGLIEVGDITHRDLKPANILLHEGKWKIADFGIAKFVEDSTSMDTLRDSLTPTYAAPEQWAGDRPTSATDVYALGCIIHALFTGHPPFQGSVEDVREFHLHKAPEQINEVSPRIAAFVSHMLRKPPAARPTLERCSNVLPDIAMERAQESKAQSALAIASKAVAEKEATEEAARQARETLSKQRQALYIDAKNELTKIKGRIFERIREQSESVKIKHNGALQFGYAGLNISNAEQLNRVHISIADNRRGALAAYDRSGLDVLGWAEITLACENPNRRESYVWSASLLYADRNDGGGFRWYEVSFCRRTQSNRGETEPFSLKGYDADMYLALGNGMHTVNVAYGPCPIDGEDEEAFVDRWMGLIAKAALGNLTAPNSMPINNFC